MAHLVNPLGVGRGGGKTCAQWRASLRDYAMPRGWAGPRVSAVTNSGRDGRPAADLA